MLDELDLAIINALQIDPRATWAVVGKALDIDAATVARRWERVRTSGSAWVTAYPYAGVEGASVIEVDCAPGHDAAVAHALAQDPQAVTVEHAAGGRDLLVTVMTADFAALSHYIVDRLGAVSGVTSTRAHPITRSYGEGSGWRLRSLSRAQQQALAVNHRGTSRPAVEPAGYRQIVKILGPDARIAVTELGARLGVSTNTASRRLTRILDSGLLMLRCDLARSLSGSPVSVTFFAVVPPMHLDATAHELAKLPETRLCVGTAGPHNLIATVWVGSLLDAQQLEVDLGRQLPHLRITDRAVALRAVKLMGRLLDTDGRATGYVPLDLWPDS